MLQVPDPVKPVAQELQFGSSHPITHCTHKSISPVQSAQFNTEQAEHVNGLATVSKNPTSHESHNAPVYPDEQVKQFVGSLQVAQLSVTPEQRSQTIGPFDDA
jgi:hypothetical protein